MNGRLNRINRCVRVGGLQSPSDKGCFENRFSRARVASRGRDLARGDLFLNNAAAFIIRYRREEDPPIVCSTR
jgi:hypothetical protein